VDKERKMRKTVGACKRTISKNYSSRGKKVVVKGAVSVEGGKMEDKSLKRIVRLFRR